MCLSWKDETLKDNRMICWLFSSKNFRVGCHNIEKKLNLQERGYLTDSNFSSSGFCSACRMPLWMRADVLNTFPCSPVWGYKLQPLSLKCPYNWKPSMQTVIVLTNYSCHKKLVLPNCSFFLQPIIVLLYSKLLSSRSNWNDFSLHSDIWPNSKGWGALTDRDLQSAALKVCSSILAYSWSRWEDIACVWGGGEFQGSW